MLITFTYVHKHNAYYVGSEHRSWVLFYLLPVLKDILPTTYFRPLFKVRCSYHVLSSDNILESDLSKTEEELMGFYEQFGQLYGESNR